MAATSTAADTRRRSAKKCANVSPVSSGVSPNSTSRSSISPFGASLPWRAASPVRTASPVPRGGSCTTLCAGSTRRATASIRGPITTTVAAGRSGVSAANRCAIIGRPATGCKTLGIADFIRVPPPAARMMAAKPDWLIDCGPNQTISAGCTVAQRRRVYNTQIVANCSPTTQRLSRDNARRAGSRRWRSDRRRPAEAAQELTTAASPIIATVAGDRKIGHRHNQERCRPFCSLPRPGRRIAATRTGSDPS